MYRTPRTLKALRNDPRVEEVVDERQYDQGYWVYLKAEFICADMDCGTIHEDTVRDLCEKMESVVAR